MLKKVMQKPCSLQKFLVHHYVAGTSPLAKMLLKCFPSNTAISGTVCQDALAQVRTVI